MNFMLDHEGDELIGEAMGMYDPDHSGALSCPPDLPPWPEKTRKVAFVTGGMLMGGAERQLAVLANGLAERGYECLLINTGLHGVSSPMDGSKVDYVESSGADIHGFDAAITWASCPESIAGEAPVIYTVHSIGMGAPELAANYAGIVDRLVGVSGPISARTEAACGMPCSTIWSGSDVSVGCVGRRSGRSFVAGFLGRFSCEKNIISLVRALTILPDHCRVRLYGAGPFGKLAYESARRCHVDDRLDLCGAVEDVERAYGELDCLVIPSVFEGFPMVACEAMLRGVPVVAVPHGDLPLLSDMGLVRAIRPDFRSIAAGIMDIISWPHKYAERAEIAQQFAARHLSVDAMCRRYAALIEGVIDGS